jgi:hypothetical protein
LTQRIVVVDDEEELAAEWGKRIHGRLGAEDWSVTNLSADDLLAAMRILEERRIAARDRRALPVTKTTFDDTAILVVDYDLAPISTIGTLTGEAVGYLARAYSSVGYIVLMNPVTDSFFDLTLRGDSESFADLIVGSQHIGSDGLWSNHFTGFRPWQWPVIPVAVEELRALTGFLRDRLDLPVLEALRLEGMTLSRQVRALLGSPSEAVDVTVRQFVASSPGGLRRKDVAADDDAVARIAAARLRRWLEYDVLSSEDALVDAPHLASRFPSLLAGPTSAMESSNATAHAGTASGIDIGAIEAHKHVLSSFISRDVWSWPELKRDRAIKEVASPLAPRDAPYLFCEDVSQFLPQEATREFVADVAGEFLRRYITDADSDLNRDLAPQLDGVELLPLSRLTGA